MRPLCVIPARHGSKRLPVKNVADVGGRPMLAWTVEAARDSGIFDVVHVTTEHPDIARIAAECGATVPELRPDELAGDTVTNVVVSLYMVEMMARRGEHYDAVVCLQPSSPLRTGRHIREAWETFTDRDANFLVSVTAIDPHYFHWALDREADGECRMFFGDRFMTVRQNLPDVFRPNGAIKIARVEALRERGNFFGDKTYSYEMPEEASVHVALPADLAVARALING